jgi:2-(1,2-epoxy-1,2-dihydrophenyl)acetyl-CoA isomerase
MTSNQTILYEVTNDVATITLNRPERLNAITDEMLAAVRDTLAAAAENRAIRVIVLTGAGRGFCAGQDVSSFGDSSGHDTHQHLLDHYKPVVELIRAIEKPVIGAINGVAAGAGASLALACDLRIMAKDASLLQAFSNIGLIPDAGSTWFLVRLVGYSRAFELAIEGKRIPAERCLELGLANRVVETERLREEAQVWAETLARRAIYAIGLTKKAMNHAATSTLSAAIEYEARLQGQAAASAEFAEGVKAFREKRPPNFRENN